MFMIFNGRGLAGRYQLRLESGSLQEGAVMLADIKGPHINNLIRLIEHLSAAVFPLQIGLLLFGQTLRMPLNPSVYGLLILFHLHITSFIEQKSTRPVLHCLVDGVMGFDQAAEFYKAI